MWDIPNMSTYFDNQYDFIPSNNFFNTRNYRFFYIKYKNS